MPARLGPRDAWVVCVHMRLARTDNRILYSFDNRVVAPYALTYLPCVKKDCLLIRAHAHRTDYRMHRCGDFLGHVGQGGLAESRQASFVVCRHASLSTC